MVAEEAKGLPDSITHEKFAKDVLGFEEIQDEDEENEGTQEEQLMYAEEGAELVPEDPNENAEQSPEKSGKSEQEIHA